MKSQNTNSIANDWLDKSAAKRIAFWFMIFLGIIWALASILNRPVVQPIYNSFILTGNGLASFPIWGYSLLILLIGSVNKVVILQSVVGALATAALMVRLNCMFPRAKTMTTILFVFALHWFSFMAYAYQMPISSAFMVLTLLAIEMAINSGKITWGIVAGVLAGLGQNFRSELLLLPGLILVVVMILKRLQWLQYQSIKPLIIAVGVALVIQIPWALNCYFNAGRFSLTESNFGHVAFVGLGKLPSNPWNIDPTDGFTQETVTKAGLECSSLSFQGGDFLRRKFLDNIKQNPSAYIKCLGARIWATIFSPFGTIGLAMNLAENQMAQQIRNRDLLSWSQLTSKAAKSVTSSNSSVSIAKIVTSKFYDLANFCIGNAVSFFGILGFFQAVRSGPFRLNHPLILCLSIAVIYRFGMNVALGDSGKYMTGVYLCYLPFVINTLWVIHERWLRFR